jgi:hypothetical protein
MVKASASFCPGIGPKILKKTATASDRVVGGSAGIQIEDFPNKN